jgi:hypothetical protein
MTQSAQMRRVIIESPYGAPTPAGVAGNIRYVRAAMRDCLRRGEAPYASHSLYTLFGVLDDKVPADRDLGMRAGWAWSRGAKIDAVCVYIDRGISPGMQAGIDVAKILHLEIEERRLGDGWAEGLDSESNLSRTIATPKDDDARARFRAYVALEEMRDVIQETFDGLSAVDGPERDVDLARDAWRTARAAIERIIRHARVKP